jgi:hypothetical protein
MVHGSGMHGSGGGGQPRESWHNFSRMERNAIPETAIETWQFANLFPFW